MTLRSQARPSWAMAVLVVAGLSGCVPLMIGGAAVGTALVATDRRTSGTQVEDQAIELKALNRLREAIGDRGHTNVTSYNRLVLIAGEVQSEADRALAEQTVQRIENVASIVNDLQIMGSSSLTARSNDVILAGKVKATLVDAKDVQAQAIKVVVERATVYLMGRVSEREAARAADLARRVGGVQKVVRVFEVVSEAELAELQPKPAK